MKKAYTKPEIIFDDFSLATTIAETCAKRFTAATKNVCSIPWAGGALFTNGMASCSTPVEVDHDGYCYHNPEDGKNLFNSL